jgi:hypothetical protein
MDEASYRELPGELEVRELRVRIGRPGFRVDGLVLVTTMLDAIAYTKEDLADLFLERWNIELDLRSIKCVLQMDVLRCKTAAMVEKEVWMHLLAYNLIRGLIAAAAEAHGLLPRRVSFKGALQALGAFREALGRAAASRRGLLLEEMLRVIASSGVGDRPGRVEPRAIKRRPKPHDLLKEPRCVARKRLMGKK